MAVVKQLWAGVRVGLGARLFILLGVVAWGCVSSPQVLAQDDFFTVAVAVEDRREASREQAIKQGLERLIGKMTGAYGGLNEDHPALAMLDQAAKYLEGYSFTSLDGELGLELRFDASALKAALGERDVAVWGRHRRPVLVWLVVDAHGRRVMLSDRQIGYAEEYQKVLATLQREASARGLPLLFPLLDWQDRSSLGYADIWGGFTANIRQASARYGGAAVISGGLRRTSTGAWRGHWTALLGENGWIYRSGPGALNEVIGDALDSFGQSLAERYAVVPGANAGRSMEIAVLEVGNVTDYVGMLNSLQGVVGVDEVNVTYVEGRRVILRLKLGQDIKLVLEDLDELPQLLIEPLPSLDLGGAAGRVVRAYRWRGEK